MAQDFSYDLEHEIEGDGTPQLTAEKLAEVKQAASVLRDTKLELENAEEHAKALRRVVRRMETEDLPELLGSVGLDRIGVEAQGNMPGFDVQIRGLYEANIAASWPEEQRERAFSQMEALGYGDLIKHTCTIYLERDEDEKLDRLVNILEENGFDNFTIAKSIHASTLRAWLREAVENGNPLPPLEDIGGFVGKKAHIKPRNE